MGRQLAKLAIATCALLVVGGGPAPIASPDEAAEGLDEGKEQQPVVTRNAAAQLEYVLGRVRELAAESPATARLVTVASTSRGPVLALEVDGTGRFSPTAPTLLVQGGVHGNEWSSSFVVLRMAELVAGGFAPVPRGLVVRLIPVVNVEGFSRGERMARDESGAPYDANRDFPVPGQKAGASRPLVAAMRAYAKRGNVVAVLDYHSDAECVLWPWAYTKAAAPTVAPALAVIAREMARSVGFCTGQVSHVIPYRHRGTAADWYQHALGAPTLLVELGTADGPASQTIDQLLLDQERPFFAFLQWLEPRTRRARRAAPPARTAAAGCSDVLIFVGDGAYGYRAAGPLCDGRRHGGWTFSSLSGEPMREGEYRAGREHGEWQTYHREGALQDRVSYVDGVPDGTWRRYAPSGQLVEERSYAAGERHGPIVRRTDNGDVYQVRQCVRGACRTTCKSDKMKSCEAPASAVSP